MGEKEKVKTMEYTTKKTQGKKKKAAEKANGWWGRRGSGLV